MANEYLFPDGATLTLDTGYSGVIQQIGGFQASVPVGDATPLAQGLSSGLPTARKMVPGKTFAHQPIVVTFFFHNEDGLPPIGQSNEATITYPEGGNSFNGDCFISEYDTGEMVGGSLVMGTYAIQFIGGDGVGDNPPHMVAP